MTGRTKVMLALSLLLSIGALVAMSLVVLEQEAARAKAHVQAQTEETMRLALWRLDAEMSTLLTTEQTRPWSDYVNDDIGESDRSDTIAAWFLWRKGSFSVLSGSPGSVNQPLKERLVASFDAAPSPVQVAAAKTAAAPVMRQAFLNDNAYDARVRNYNSSLNIAGTVSRRNAIQTGASVGLLKPRWVGKDLVLTREVTVDGELIVEGVLFNWTKLESQLAENISELLSSPSFKTADDTSPAGRRLASLPLIVDGRPRNAEAFTSTARTSLAFGWISMLFALGLAAVMVRGIVKLSERRAAFVSAVTHELRTPLTTMQMYTEMLAAGMVSDEEKRQHYQSTVHDETKRLGHLVENVLAYARIERRPGKSELGEHSVASLLDRAAQNWRHRAATVSDTTISVEMTDATLVVKADPEAVTRILFNLVDNALKYGGSNVRVWAVESGRRVTISVTDTGPGVSKELQRRLFRPFEKSADQAANSAPGVGLGLALSRELAREMGGDLRYLDSDMGATFELTLRAA
ncbi:MAG: signal transduction histidine kinase [Myxococcota bacterium]